MLSPGVRVQRSIWLMTLADLGLLLIGFFVFIQATSRFDERTRAELAAGIRDAFAGSRVVAPAPPPPIAVDVNIVSGFDVGSAGLSEIPGALIDWARASTVDPRTHLLVTGFADGSPADALDESALALAAARAGAVAARIEASGIVSRDRIRVAAALAPGNRAGEASARRVSVMVSFGE